VVAVGSSSPAFIQAVGDAERHGASADDVVDVMCAIASVIGTARVVDAAPLVASALGIDIQYSLENFGPPTTPGRV
jgi:hypothetical protein